MKKILLLLVISLHFQLFSQDISGGWTGSLKVQGMELPLVFNFVKSATGYTATMDSPKQGAKDIPVDIVNFNDKKLVVEVRAIAIKYTGEWKSEAEIDGTFQQGAFSSPMTLKRGVVQIIKPQEPTKPFPYYTEDVSFINAKENIALAGTLTLPKKEGTFPAVILISGSGQQNRDSEILGHKPFLVLSDYLTRNGIAVLRYDDRGVGQSKGDPTLSTSADFANDAAAAIAYLRTRPEIDLKKMGVIGHSEGGMIAPMLAANDKKIAFLVLLAGTGVAGDVLLVDQNYQIGKLSRMTPEQLNEAKISNQKIYNILKSDAELNVVKNNLRTHFQADIDRNNADEKSSEQDMADALQQQIESIATPWIRFFLKHNPQDDLKKVKCPVLVLNGEKDIQVSAILNTEGITKALNEGGNKKVTTTIFPGLNHLFQHCKTCTVDEYAQLEETFAPEVLKTITDWIQLQTR